MATFDEFTYQIICLHEILYHLETDMKHSLLKMWMWKPLPSRRVMGKPRRENPKTLKGRLKKKAQRE